MITETTFGGLKELSGKGTGALMSYGSLIWVTLQRARTAKEAIQTMDSLCQKYDLPLSFLERTFRERSSTYHSYGYESAGESFSIADKDEAWLMELIGKGEERGAVWVATRVPEGFIGAHANQARTRTFARDDPDNVRYSKDVVSFAKKRGFYPATGRCVCVYVCFGGGGGASQQGEALAITPRLSARDEDFSFSDVYDPVSFVSARLAEAR